MSLIEFLASLSLIACAGCSATATHKPAETPPTPAKALAPTPETGRRSPQIPAPINSTFPGVTCFRGNAQRSYYGEGPIPVGKLRVLWRQPIGAVDANWNGVGWTGQPLAVQWPDEVRKWMNFLKQPGPRTEIVQAALDGNVHFFDADTGARSRNRLKMPAPFPIKGTATLDPRGYPLLYVGCGLNRGVPGYRVYSLVDFKQLHVVKGIDPIAPRSWPAFDSNGIVVDDTLFVLGENGVYYQIALNTKWDSTQGKVSVAPVTTKFPVHESGIESSVAIWEGKAYFGDNVGNLWRLDTAKPARPTRVATLGDDADCTVTVDAQGSLYVGIEVDKTAGKGGKGRLHKYRSTDMKRLWTYSFTAGNIPKVPGKNPINGGIVSTPAIWDDGGIVFITTTHHPSVGGGYLIALDAETGKTRWQQKMRGYGWSSPIVVGGRVAAFDSSGNLWVRDALTGKNLLERESFSVGGHVEASPIVFEGKLFIGVRGGALVCVGN